MKPEFKKNPSSSYQNNSFVSIRILFFFLVGKTKHQIEWWDYFNFFFFFLDFVYNFLCNQTLNSGWSNLIRTKRDKRDQRYLVTAAQREIERERERERESSRDQCRVLERV